MEATAYPPNPNRPSSRVRGRTASGYAAGYGLAAVDPKVIPLGTPLFIEGYGFALAADTGGAIKGKRIDLCFETNALCNAFGRRNVRVHILNSH
jgi:3D (Asp-Asp-Asp) domain-containing protein